MLVLGVELLHVGHIGLKSFNIHCQNVRVNNQLVQVLLARFYLLIDQSQEVLQNFILQFDIAIDV